MVSNRNLFVYGALGLGAFLAFTSLGGASGIGNRIGGGLKSFTDSILNPFKSMTTEQPVGTTKTIVEDLQLGGNVTNVPSADNFATDRERNINRESLALAALFQSVGSDVKVDLSNLQLLGDRFVQPIDFVFNKEGFIRTGTSGLSSETLAAQARLSEQYGIATFDQSGAISTIGGLVSGN